MFILHMCSGRPVLADCWWANSSGVCVPSPIGSVAFSYSSPAFFTFSSNSANRNLPQDVAGLLSRPHVAADDAAVGLADLGDRLAGDEVLDLIDFERLIRLAPAEGGDFEGGHGRSPE